MRVVQYIARALNRVRVVHYIARVAKQGESGSLQVASVSHVGFNLTVLKYYFMYGRCY